MTATEYCDALNLEIHLTYYPNQRDRWTASFGRCEVKDVPDSVFLCAAYGNGETPQLAIRDYIDKIRGKMLVVDAMGDQRRIYTVPDSLIA